MIRVSFTYPEEWKKYVKRQTENFTISDYFRLLLEIDLYNAYFLDESENCQKIIESNLKNIIDSAKEIDFSQTYYEILGKKPKKDIQIDYNKIIEALDEELNSSPILVYSSPISQLTTFLILHLNLENIKISWADSVAAYINFLVLDKYVNQSELVDILTVEPENYTELSKLKKYIEEILQKGGEYEKKN